MRKTLIYSMLAAVPLCSLVLLGCNSESPPTALETSTPDTLSPDSVSAFLPADEIPVDEAGNPIDLGTVDVEELGAVTFQGTVERLPLFGNRGFFRIDGVTVWIRNGTTVIGGPISVGEDVEVSGFELTSTFVIANLVTVVDTQTPPPSNFDLTLDFVDNTLTPSQRNIVQQAASRWEQVVTGDVPNGVTGTLPSPNFCGPSFPNVPPGTPVDDILVQVSAASLISQTNQPGGTLAQAGPCGFFRTGSGIFLTGRVAFDPTDIDNLEAGGDLFPVTLHELGHVLGIGTNWDQFELGNPPTQFTGPQARSQFNNLGGFGNVPLQSGGGHWDEPALETELMTPFIILGGGSNPLSRVTVGALGDINFPGINLNAADAYSLPGDTLESFDEQVVIDLTGDAVLGPVVDQEGRVILPMIVYQD